MVVHPINSGTM